MITVRATKVIRINGVAPFDHETIDQLVTATTINKACWDIARRVYPGLQNFALGIDIADGEDEGEIRISMTRPSGPAARLATIHFNIA